MPRSWKYWYTWNRPLKVPSMICSTRSSSASTPCDERRAASAIDVTPGGLVSAPSGGSAIVASSSPDSMSYRKTIPRCPATAKSVSSGSKATQITVSP